MERCDFSSIITTVRKYIGDDRGMNQIDLLYELFEGSGRCIPYMEKYHYTAGMELVIGKLSGLLSDETVGRSTDRALLLDYRAACEEKTEKAIRLEKEAIALIPEISEGNALLVSNLYSNLGGLYKNGIWHSRLWNRAFGS